MSIGDRFVRLLNGVPERYLIAGRVIGIPIMLIAACMSFAIQIHRTLDEFIDEDTPILELIEPHKQWLSGDTRSIIIKINVIKHRDCRLLSAKDITASITQNTFPEIVYLAPIPPMRPDINIQQRLIQFNIPKKYSIKREGILSLDLQYHCKKGDEYIYLDLPIRVFTQQETVKKTIMDISVKQRNSINELGKWKKGK